MLKSIFENLKFLFTFVDEVRRLRSEQREIRDAMEDIEKGYGFMASAVRELARDLAHSKETSQIEREKLLLQLENELLKFERRLPPKSE